MGLEKIDKNGGKNNKFTNSLNIRIPGHKVFIRIKTPPYFSNVPFSFTQNNSHKIDDTRTM